MRSKGPDAAPVVGFNWRHSTRRGVCVWGGGPMRPSGVHTALHVGFQCVIPKGGPDVAPGGRFGAGGGVYRYVIGETGEGEVLTNAYLKLGETLSQPRCVHILYKRPTLIPALTTSSTGPHPHSICTQQRCTFLYDEHKDTSTTQRIGASNLFLFTNPPMPRRAKYCT